MTMTASKVTGVDASYYYVQDYARAVAFYTKLLGAAPTQSYEGMFAEWTFGDDTSFGIYKSDRPGFQPSGSVMFAVADVPAALADAKALGVEVEEHVEETPVCFMGFAVDTEGNRLILHKRKVTD
jgi:predicted enzyme related to lactoylglutathione lyase